MGGESTREEVTETRRTEGHTERVIGNVDHGRSGPTFLAQAGIHGNEPAGVEALRRVIATLTERAIQVHGRVVACRGNLQALRIGQRFLERDLNRQWLRPTVARLLSQDPEHDTAEDHEQRELVALYQRCFDERRGPIVFLDLHTSSADGPPFTCMADTLPNRRIADAIPAPMILGLEECIDGAVMEWFNERGQIGVAVEGGKHDEMSTIDNLESAIWLALCAAGVVAREDAEVPFHEERIRQASRGVPHLFEIRHRHAIVPEERFTMVAGYVSFQPVTQGEVLGQDVHGAIRAREDAMVLLPLYQGQGEDGFFLGRRVERFWFGISGLLRRLRLAGLVRLLPGVRRDPNDRNTLLVNPKVARVLVVQIFHLFGYRRLRPREGLHAFSRRWAAPECYRVGPR